MTRKNARIRDALKTEYADFVVFCVSLDKQFISELTTSDFIAFRTQHGATRDYVANIRHALDSYDPDTEIQQQESQSELSVDEPAAIEETEAVEPIADVQNAEDTSEEAEPEEEPVEAIPEEQEFDAAEPSLTEESTNESNETINEADDQPTSASIVAPQKIFSSGKAWFNYLEELRGINVEAPIYEALGIPHNASYADRSISELKLSTRPYNRLNGNHRNTLHDLFSATIVEISEYPNMGKTSLLEIVNKCKKFVAAPQAINTVTEADKAKATIPAAKANEKLIRIAESIALGIEYDASELTDAEKNYAALLEEAYQVLGEELCLMALEEPDKMRSLCSVFDDYVKQQELHRQIVQIVSRVADHGISMTLHVLPFVAASKKKTPIDLNTVFTENDCFIDATQTIEKYLEDKPDEQIALINSLRIFTDEIGCGISKQLEKAYEYTMTTDRVPVVLRLRQEGRTLAEVGDVLDITRERVRQIEAKAISRFSTSLRHAGRDVIGYIHAMLDGDLMIHKNEVATCIENSDQLDLLWACIEDGAFDRKAYSYEKQYKAIVFKHEDGDVAAKIVDALPSYIFKDELEEVIRHAVEEEGVWEEKIRADIKQRYRVFGTLYSEHKPTVVFICDWLLKNRFVNGFKVSDATDAKRFQEYAREVFGEGSCRMTQRALDAKINAVGVLCDRGKYIHPSMVSIDESILDEVDQYIADSPKNAITYIELFEAFKDKLAGTQISNHYLLQGVMKQFGNNVNKRVDYYLYRDYITKDANVSPTDELDAFVRDRGMVHKTEIYAEFPALNEFALGQVVARCPNVFNIDGGYYIHASQFHIQETDYAPLIAYLTEVTRDLPVNIRKVFDDCSVQFPEFMDRNEIHNRDVLFAVLSHMFRYNFRFNRPYIANSDDVEMTNRGVILSVLEPYAEIAIDELMDLLDERGIHYVSLPHLMGLIAPDYVRSDENTLMKRSLAGIDDDVVEEALNILSDAIEANDYLPSCKVQDFIWYPSIDIAWTPYLLESIVLSSNRLDYVPYPFSRSHRSLVVYVSKKYANYDFQTMLLKIIGEEYEKGTFTRKADMREWLIEAGFVDVKLPNFLESAQYYYMGDDGRLVRREEAEQ